jgi:uncharacterized protein DUF4115
VTIRMIQRLAFAAAALIAFGLLVLNVLAWSGVIVEGPAGSAEETPPPAEPVAEPPSLTPPTPVSKRPQPPASPPTLSITATRGDCWVEVRAGSSTGSILYAATLASGNTVRFHRDKVWLRLGAASNVDLTVNGRPSEIPPGTVELLVPA